MNIDEGHAYEDELRKELEEKDPDNRALKYYGSTWDAIDAYEYALKMLKFREAEKMSDCSDCGRKGKGIFPFPKMKLVCHECMSKRFDRFNKFLKGEKT